MLTGAGAGFGAFVLQALLATFALGLGVQGGLDRSTVLWLFAAGSLVQVLALPSYAALSDRLGHRPVMIGGAITGAGLTYPIFTLIAVMTRSRLPTQPARVSPVRACSGASSRPC